MPCRHVCTIACVSGEREGILFLGEEKKGVSVPGFMNTPGSRARLVETRTSAPEARRGVDMLTEERAQEMKVLLNFF